MWMDNPGSRRAGVASLLAIMTVFGFCTSIRAEDRVVPTGYATIQAAVDAAQPGDRVLLQNGTYSGPGNRDIDLGTKNLTIASQSNKPEFCIIDCQHAGRAFRIVGGQTSATRITGVTISNGLAPITSFPGEFGGAVVIVGSSPTIANCAFVANTAQAGGAVFVASNGAPLLSDCAFVENSGTIQGGGGVYIDTASATVLRCTFSGNSAAVYGGGVAGSDVERLNVINCTFLRNTALVAGGGVVISGGEMDVQNCVFQLNNGSEFGGGLGLNEGRATVTSCTFSGNTSAQGGAVVLYGEATLINSILWGDTAPSDKEIALMPGSASIPSSALVVACNVDGGLPPGVTDGGGNTDHNPQFVRATQTSGPHDPGDLRLRPESPSVDAGNNSLLPPDTHDLDNDSDTAEPHPHDLTGLIRLVGGRVDQGAHELPSTPGVDVRMTYTLSRDTTTNEILVTVTLRNRGTDSAQNVQITAARLGGQSALTTLPTSPVTLDASTVHEVVLRFPAVSAGQRSVLTLTGRYTGGTLGGSCRVTVP